MRLLSKEEVVTQKASERKREIDEGAKLARKVDALREESASEETRLAKFRAENLKKIGDEVSALIVERDRVSTDIEKARAEREELRKPLDQEWAMVWEEAKIVTSERDRLTQKAVNQIIKEVELKQREADLDAKASSILKANSDSQSLLREAHDARVKAENAERTALNTVADAERYAEIKVSELLAREADIAGRERDTDIREKSLNSKERALNEKEQFINDKYATLERTINRLKK